MIHKLKRKFILLATAAMLALMTVLPLAMNLLNFTAVKNEADSVLSVLSHPDLPFRNQDPTAESVPGGQRENDRHRQWFRAEGIRRMETRHSAGRGICGICVVPQPRFKFFRSDL